MGTLLPLGIVTCRAYLRQRKLRKYIKSYNAKRERKLKSFAKARRAKIAYLRRILHLDDKSCPKIDASMGPRKSNYLRKENIHGPLEASPANDLSSSASSFCLI